jgi:hypothetical protein
MTDVSTDTAGPMRAPAERLHPDRFVDDVEAAALLSLSRSYMRQLRFKGGGCAFSSFGRAVRYRVSDLFEWAASKSATSTSNRGRGAQ